MSLDNVLDATGPEYDSRTVITFDSMFSAKIKMVCCSVASRASENYCRGIIECFDAVGGVDYCSC